MRTAPLHINLEDIAASHHGFIVNTDFHCRGFRPIVATEVKVRRKFLHESVGNHVLSTESAFFSGLENKNHRAVKVFGFRQITGG